jgi:hypothetical protein
MVNTFGFNPANQLNFQRFTRQQNLFGNAGTQGSFNTGFNTGIVPQFLLGNQGFGNTGGLNNFSGLNLNQGFNGFQGQQGIFSGIGLNGGFMPPPPDPATMFTAMDANGDSVLTRDELANGPQNTGTTTGINFPQPTDEMKAEMWARMDVNGDDQVTQEEFIQAGPPPGPPPGGFGFGFGPGGPGGPGQNPELDAAHQKLDTDLATAGIDPEALRQTALETAIGQVTDTTLQAKLQTDLATLDALGKPTEGTAPTAEQMAAHQQLQVDLRSAGIDMRQVHEDALTNAIAGVTDETLRTTLQEDVATLDALRPQPPAFGIGNGFGGGQIFGNNLAAAGFGNISQLGTQSANQFGLGNLSQLFSLLSQLNLSRLQ